MHSGVVNKGREGLRSMRIPYLLFVCIVLKQTYVYSVFVAFSSPANLLDICQYQCLEIGASLCTQYNYVTFHPYIHVLEQQFLPSGENRFCDEIT